MESLLRGKRFFCREWAFQKLQYALDEDCKKNGYIITGSPGSGKTAFLTELCFPTNSSNAHFKQSILAVYFVVSSSSHTKTINNFFNIFTKQINQKIEGLNLQNHGDDITTVVSNWNKNFKGQPSPGKKYFIVIDGIELSDDVLNAVLLIQFPKWIIPIYSISHIHGNKNTKDKIKMFQHLNRLYMDDLRKEHISRDSQHYILKRLETDSKLKSLVTKDSAEMLNQLHIKASGCFIYLEIILNLINQQTITLRQIKDIPGTLSGLWLWLAQKLFGKTKFSSVKGILELMIAYKKPITFNVIYNALRFRETKISNSEVQNRLHSFGPLLIETQKGYLPIHESFLTWSQDVKYSTTRYLCDAIAGHWTLVVYYCRCCLKLKGNTTKEEEYKTQTMLLSTHIKQCDITEEQASYLLVSVGHEKEVIKYMTRLAGASLIETGCELTHFASRGECHQVRTLLERGVNPNGVEHSRRESNLIPVIAAAKIGNLEMVKLFIQYKTDLTRSELSTKSNLCHAAAQHGHYSIINYLLGILPEKTLLILLNELDIEGRTPARISAWEGQLNIIISIGRLSELNTGDLENRTPLFAACYMQHVDVVIQLLKYPETDPNITDHDHRSPLTIAALQNQTEICSHLLSAGANVNHVDDDGLTALHTASYEKNAEIARLLIKVNCDIDCKDNMCMTPLMAATTVGSETVVSLLLEAGASIDYLDQDCRTVLSIAASQGHHTLIEKYLEQGLDESHIDNCGWTPLHLAGAENHCQAAQALLEFGANPDQLDKEGRTPLIIAAMEGHTKMVKTLLQAGTDPDIQSYDGFSALRHAVLEGHVPCVKILVDGKADVDSLDTDDRSILYGCVLEQNFEMSKLILRLGADPETKDEEGRSPIHVAAWQGSVEMVKLLLDYGATADSTDNEGRTALQNAAWQNHSRVVELLANNGANLSHSCQQGATPLCVAAQEGHVNTCQALIKLGANPHQPDKCGRTPLRVAEKAGHTELAQILAKTPQVPLPIIKNTNTKSFSDLQTSTQTNSSGILSDQNLSGPSGQNENTYEVIDDIIKREILSEQDSSDSGTYLSFLEEVKLRTLPRSMQRSTMKLNDVESRHNPPPLLRIEPKPLNESSAQSSNPNSSINSNLNYSNYEDSKSSKSTPNKRLRRSTSIKGKMSQLSKRVSKMGLGFKSDKSEEDGMADLGISYRKVVGKQENLANPVNPACLTSNKIPIEKKLPQWIIDRNNDQMEFECDNNTAAKLRINEIIHQSLRRKQL